MQMGQDVQIMLFTTKSIELTGLEFIATLVKVDELESISYINMHASSSVLLHLNLLRNVWEVELSHKSY